jgi:hypothetical protein
MTGRYTNILNMHVIKHHIFRIYLIHLPTVSNWQDWKLCAGQQQVIDAL